MTQAEFEAALQAAFEQCDIAGHPLDFQQKQILLKAFFETFFSEMATKAQSIGADSESNPLDELTPEQRQTLLEFVREQENQGQAWKVQLLNDWLQSQSSGEVQFIRNLYGPQWLERVQDVHLTQYAEDLLALRVGDRIEVSNGLWEWVQDEGPCSREWLSCVVINLTETCDTASTLPVSYQSHTSCTIRFENGSEYEIQGIYDWNRYNWRRMRES
jgi:hypothetical protein